MNKPEQPPNDDDWWNNQIEEKDDSKRQLYTGLITISFFIFLFISILIYLI